MMLTFLRNDTEFVETELAVAVSVCLPHDGLGLLLHRVKRLHVVRGAYVVELVRCEQTAAVLVEYPKHKVRLFFLGQVHKVQHTKGEFLHVDSSLSVRI